MAESFFYTPASLLILSGHRPGNGGEVEGFRNSRCSVAICHRAKPRNARSLVRARSRVLALCKQQPWEKWISALTMGSV